MLLNNILPQHGLRDFVRLYRIIHFDFTHTGKGLTNIKAYALTPVAFWNR